jgi:hypothetical protein
MFEGQTPLSRMVLKIGVAGFIGFGALATGLFTTRKGRHLVREAWQGRERTRLEDRVLDKLWDDPVLARRDLDVDEIDGGRIELIGNIHSYEERERAVRLAAAVKGVNNVVDRLDIVPRRESRLRRLREVALRDL